MNLSSSPRSPASAALEHAPSSRARALAPSGRLGASAATPERAGRAAAALAGLGALPLTSCCSLPLALVSLGVGGVFTARPGALHAYEWLTFALAAGALAFGFWRAYRPVPCGDRACAPPVSRRRTRFVLSAAVEANGHDAAVAASAS